MGGNGQDLDDDVFRDIMAEGDENGDGEIDFDEFKNMMKKLLGRPQNEGEKGNELILRPD
jgi:Ca2+-binding EF-hand superfamily protein